MGGGHTIDSWGRTIPALNVVRPQGVWIDLYPLQYHSGAVVCNRLDWLQSNQFHQQVQGIQMKSGQGLSPKYWVGHHKENDDIMVFSMSKSRDGAVTELESAYGEDWFMDDNIEIILIEINRVVL